MEIKCYGLSSFLMSEELKRVNCKVLFWYLTTDIVQTVRKHINLFPVS